MKNDFHINNDLFETNIINLIIVFRIVVKFVGDSLSNFLDKCREFILMILKEFDQQIMEVQYRLKEAKKVVKIARMQAQEIRVKALCFSENINLVMKRYLKKDLQRLPKIQTRSTKLQRQRIVRSIGQQFIDLAFTNIEEILIKYLIGQEVSHSNQQKLNQTYVQEIFRKLGSSSLS